MNERGNNMTTVQKALERKEKSSLTVVFRGPNEFMSNLALALKAKGFEVKTHIIQADYNLLSEEDQGRLIKELNLSGDVVTDRTVSNGVKFNSVAKRLDVYDLMWEDKKPETLEQIEEIFAPIVDSIRSQGKIPVVFQKFLGEHVDLSEKLWGKKFPGISDVPHDERDWEEQSKKADAIVAALGRMSVPVIRRDAIVSNNRGEFFEGNVVKQIESIGLSVDDVVLLADHHICEIAGGKSWVKTGFNEVKISYICPCDMGKGGKSEADYIAENEEGAVLKFFETTYNCNTKNIDAIVERIIKKI